MRCLFNRNIYKESHTIFIMAFKPKQIILLHSAHSFKYVCQPIEDKKGNKTAGNKYRFYKGVPYLIKTKEDYEELIANSNFKDFDAKVVEPTKSARQIAREKREAEKAESEKAKADVPVEPEVDNSQDEVPKVE